MLTGAAEQNADHQHRSSLCTRQQRPRERCAAKKRAPLPPPHWAPLAAEKRPRDYQVSAHAALVRCTAVCNPGEAILKYDRSTLSSGLAPGGLGEWRCVPSTDSCSAREKERAARSPEPPGLNDTARQD